MKILLHTKCPYCKHINTDHFSSELYTLKTVVTCEPEEGGCERDYVVKHWVKPKLTCHKIGGE